MDRQVPREQAALWAAARMDVSVAAAVAWGAVWAAA